MTDTTSRLTPEQWKRIGDALAFPYGEVELEVDGYRVALQVRMVAPRRFEITPFVNGEFKGKWLNEDCEERRRFLREQIRQHYSRARIERATAKMSKRAAKQFAADYMSGATACYNWTWPAFAPLKRHLIKHNASIRLVAINSIGEPEQ